MKPFLESEGMYIYCGHVLDVLRELPTESVHCVVTSPPYWGLRDYGLDPVTWPDGWRGSLGLECAPELYVEHMVTVFREVWRVLRADGTLWLNLGDCYATGAGKVGEHPGGGRQGDNWKGHRGARGGSAKQPHTGSAIGPMTQPNRMPLAGLKPKDLIGVPWRVAFALQADGWYLRSDIIWSKPNPMPESVTDRPTKAHEYLFLLAKSERYYFDADGVKQAAVTTGDRRFERTDRTQEFGRHGGDNRKRTGNPTSECRNIRSVWTVPTRPYPEAHFAVFPEKLIEPCVKAGCPKGGTVLDPFLGSGTTAVLARRLDCRCIGIEAKREYCDLAINRLSQHMLDFRHGENAKARGREQAPQSPSWA